MRRWLLPVLLLLARPVAAQPALDPPPFARLPLDLPAVEATGRRTTLRAATGGLPTLLIFADYGCTTLCGTTLSLVAGTLPETGLRAGRDYALLVLGVDPRDGPADAASMRDAHLGAGTQLAGEAHLLTAPEATLSAVRSALGLRVVYRPETDGFDHPLALLALAPDGRLRGVLPALRPEPAELRAALAGEGAILRGVVAICRSLGLNVTFAVRAALAAAIGVSLLGLVTMLWAMRRRQARGT